MKNSIKLIFISIIICCISTNTIAQNQPLIRFGLIADIQYADCEDQGKRSYRKSLLKLEDCVTQLNLQKVDFTINLGDLIDSRNPVLQP